MGLNHVTLAFGVVFCTFGMINVELFPYDAVFIMLGSFLIVFGGMRIKK